MYLSFSVQKEKLYLLFYTVVGNLALINLGATVVYSAVVLPVLTNNTSPIVLNGKEIPLFASIIFLTRLVGCFLCPLTLNYGRRCTMIVSGISFFIGWTLIASSYSVIQLFVGRSITGIGVGFSAYSINIYFEEISTASLKQVIGTSTSIGMVFGILMVYLLGYVIKNNWRLIAAIFIVPSVLLVLCNIFFMSESPKFLLMKGQKEAAKIALLRIRGLREETKAFQDEFAEMVNYVEATKNHETSRKNQSDSSTGKEMKKRSYFAQSAEKLKSIRRVILLPEVWKPFVILNFYFFFTMFCGYVVLSYTVDVFIVLNITMDPFLSTTLVGLSQLIGIIIATCCNTRLGRRAMSIVSGVGISISWTVLILYLQFYESTRITAIPVACIIFYVGFGAYGFFSIPWALLAELYPTKYVSVLGQLTTLSVGLFNYVVVELYPMMVTQGKNAIFYYFLITSVVATIFVIIALPETKAKTKTEIEAGFKTS
ncbi:hypothetical protein PUN28_007646 [Cardiocondyla obscurior]|uniref:Major facilitator superfamily (MFS) profile domain-containing protein n=1 Tax=Cardiocondyla obscurior TaxID=286306 RepID=A0AAW2G6D1_9HYME